MMYHEYLIGGGSGGKQGVGESYRGDSEGGMH